VVDDMGFVLLLSAREGWRLPTTEDHSARPGRLVGSYDGHEVRVAPVDGDELPGDWFDPVDLPKKLDALAKAAVGDMIRGQYGVERTL
jgi:hypothetical protein